MITHPEKVLFPDDGITKGELAAYYEAIAPVMLPHLAWPAGDDGALSRRHRQEGLLAEGRVEGLSRVAASASRCRRRTASSTIRVVTDARSLLWLANQNTITPHVWTSRVPELDHPDICVFDLDPSEDDPDGAARRGARAARSARRARAAELGQDVRLEGLSHRRAARRQDADRRRRALRARGRRGAREARPDDLTQEFSKADRGGRIYVDTGRNGYSATFAAAYTVRAKPGAPVSAPCTWEEVERGEVGPADVHAAQHGRRASTKVGDGADMPRCSYRRTQPDPEAEDPRPSQSSSMIPGPVCKMAKEVPSTSPSVGAAPGACYPPAIQRACRRVRWLSSRAVPPGTKPLTTTVLRPLPRGQAARRGGFFTRIQRFRWTPTGATPAIPCMPGRHRIVRRALTGCLAVALHMAHANGLQAQIDVLTNRYDGARTGANLSETTLTPRTSTSTSSAGSIPIRWTVRSTRSRCT